VRRRFHIIRQLAIASHRSDRRLRPSQSRPGRFEFVVVPKVTQRALQVIEDYVKLWNWITVISSWV
jgi:hypothetical protein